MLCRAAVAVSAQQRRPHDRHPAGKTRSPPHPKRCRSERTSKSLQQSVWSIQSDRRRVLRVRLFSRNMTPEVIHFCLRRIEAAASCENNSQRAKGSKYICVSKGLVFETMGLRTISFMCSTWPSMNVLFKPPLCSVILKSSTDPPG